MESLRRTTLGIPSTPTHERFDIVDNPFLDPLVQHDTLQQSLLPRASERSPLGTPCRINDCATDDGFLREFTSFRQERGEELSIAREGRQVHSLPWRARIEVEHVGRAFTFDLEQGVKLSVRRSALRK